MKKYALLYAVLAIVANSVRADEVPTANDARAIANDLVQHPPANLDGYWSLKKRVGADTFQEIQQLFVGSILVYGNGNKCNVPGIIYTEESALTLAMDIKDDATWARVSAQIAQARAGWDAAKRDLIAGTSNQPFYAVVADAYRREAMATDPRARQLAHLVAENQRTLYDDYVIRQGLLWAKGLTPDAREYLHEDQTPIYCQAHIDAADWLEKDVNVHGWPKISTSVAQMDEDAGQIALGAPTAKAFQHKVLDMLTPLVASQDTSAANYAKLYDKVAYNDDKPQRYGTRFQCDMNKPGTWSLYPTEDPANLDARRTALGLPSEAAYSKAIAGGPDSPCW